jgi:hypothetical protein
MSLVYAKDPGLWKVHLAPPGALEKYLESDQRVEWATYLTEAVSNSLETEAFRKYDIDVMVRITEIIKKTYPTNLEGYQR